jgi:hypothetical protein
VVTDKENEIKVSFVLVLDGGCFKVEELMAYLYAPKCLFLAERENMKS